MESSLTQVGISFTKQKNGVVSGSKKKKGSFLYKVEGVFGDRLFNYWCLDKEKFFCPRWLILKGLFCVNWLRKTCEKGKF